MRKILVLCVAVLGVIGINAQTKVGDATLPNNITIKGSELKLNGAGVREKLWIDLYAGGLYLTGKSDNASQIIASEAAMCIKLHIVSGLVTQEKMIDAVTEGFENTTTGFASKNQIDKFISFFNEEIVKGNIFDIYARGGQVTAYKNGELLGTVEGQGFKEALFGIWLSEKPADKKLKKAMLN
ncbi:chalcone isomerase family protein [Zhouia spongiae]|uniref:Chalcone isomerase family protein n=1 Tax=Zhouia spongiae TaxID=2202721 RepID=A0ABY3YJ29_9FLAO|nr:chalcone isomerase family protein [Zhouia spongiae]UNY97700.1 chalcone isomerase family protein [Zhouia spongiae]